MYKWFLVGVLVSLVACGQEESVPALTEVEYAERVCLTQSDEDYTWQEMSERLEGLLEAAESTTPPVELENYHRARVELLRVTDKATRVLAKQNPTGTFTATVFLTVEGALGQPLPGELRSRI